MATMSPINSLYRILLNWLLHERPADDLRQSDFKQLSQTLRPGDVLLVDGRSRLDARLKNITTSRWSSSVLYIGRLHDIADPALRVTLSDYHSCDADTQLVICTRLDRGLTLQTLSSLEDEHLRICRPGGLEQGDISEVIRYAISRLGVNSGSAWGVILWMLFPWGLLPRHWRARLFARMAGRRLRNYTGNTIGEAFAFIQFPVLPLVKQTDAGNSRLFRRHPRSHYAADFDHSPYFEIIKYPFVDQASPRYGDLIPWQGSNQAADQPTNLQLVDDDTQGPRRA